MKKTTGFVSIVSMILCLLFITCGDGNEDDDTLLPPEKSSAKEISSFTLRINSGGKSVNVVGLINQKNSTIELKPISKLWIDNLDAAQASFVTTGKTVKVGDVVQENNVSKNDFSKDLIYTVLAEDGSTRDYTVSVRSPQTTGLPVVKIDIENGVEITEKTESYYTTAISIIDPDNDANNIEYGLEKKTGIRGRGNSTWWYPKKPFRLKFDKKVSLFGLGAAKSWVLLANYQDPTLIMNSVAFELGNRIGLPFTNHAHHVELFMNGAYNGSYVLTEQVQVNEHRVDVNEKTGFLVELDSYYDEDPKFKTDKLQVPIMIKSPEDLADPSGYDFVKNDINALTNALSDPLFPNSGYRDLIDMDVFVDFLLVNELVRNTELYHPKSMYMYKKDPSSKIGMGPLWDFDWGFGYTATIHNYFTYPTDMLLGPTRGNDGIGYGFFRRFFDDPEFRKLYKARWNDLYQRGVLNLDSYIDGKRIELNYSQVENFGVWTASFSYSNEIDKMKTWLNTRIRYLNTEINKW